MRQDTIAVSSLLSISNLLYIYVALTNKVINNPKPKEVWLTVALGALPHYHHSAGKTYAKLLHRQQAFLRLSCLL